MLQGSHIFSCIFSSAVCIEMGAFPYLHRFRAILDWGAGGWNMDEARGREKVENGDGCCGKTTFIDGFQSLIINRAPKQCVYACFFLP